MKFIAIVKNGRTPAFIQPARQTCRPGYILRLRLFLSLFNWRTVIPRSTGPIFTNFSPNGRYLRECKRSGPLFPISQGTLSWQPLLWQKLGIIFMRSFSTAAFQTDCNITIPIHKYSMAKVCKLFLQTFASFWSIYFIFTARGYAKRGICRRRVSVCLSVTLRYCIKTAKRRITQTTPHDSFLMPKIMAIFERDQVGWIKICNFRRKTCYKSKTVQDRRIVSIKVE